jgi:outer membrane protein OmpA-like peptidoglycan-associated protein
MNRLVHCVLHGTLIAVLGACAIAPSRAPEAPEAERDASAPGPDDRQAASERPGGDAGAEVALLPRNDHEAALHARRTRLLEDRGEALAVEEAGYYLDVQEARIRQALSAENVGIQRREDALLLRISGTAAFDMGSTTLKQRVHPILDALAEVLREYRKTLVVVAAHTDASGSPALNQRLSERRALATGRYLAARGVEAARITAIGYGESRPLASERAPRDRWPNRRLEIRLELLDQPEA